jgi:hypothetical protein
MKRVSLHLVRTTLLSAALVAALGACNRTPPDEAPAAAGVPAPSVSAAPAPTPGYTRPTADQLYALVSPIALFPDKLVALTLAGSTHPDQVDAARGFLDSNRNLNGGALIDAADAQPWDPSVKSLVAFPAVLDQLATNRDWTAALGDAYANEPTDVMNAIQVMRDRARSHGSLKSSSQQVVQVDEAPPVDEGESVASIVPAPTRTIVIEQAESDVVYVPQYDPDVVYGEPVYSNVYRTHWYEAPATRGDVVTAGLVSFGAGILVGQLFASHDHHDRPHGGWNEWNTSWGRSPRGDYRGRPAVVYDNHPYVVNRTTINRTVNNTYVNRPVNIDNRHDNGNVAIHNAPPEAQQRPQQRPDFDHMQRPNFTAAMAHPTAANERPVLPPQARPGQAPEARPGQVQDPRQQAFAHRGDEHGQPPQRPVQAATPPARPTQPLAQAAARPEQQQPNRTMQHEDPRVANVHAVGARPQPFDNSHARPTEAPRPAPTPTPHIEQPNRPQPQPQQRSEPQHEHPERQQEQQQRQQPQHQQQPAQHPQPQHENHAPPAHHDHEKHDN